MAFFRRRLVKILKVFLNFGQVRSVKVENILYGEMKNVTYSHDQNQAHPHPNPYYCDPSYGQGFNQMDSMSQNMTSNRLHEWNDRQGNWGTGQD